MEIKLQEQLLDLVDKPTWKLLLIDVVNKAGIDPWDVDVSILTTKYLEKINAMTKLDFRVPANCVLASAILVRFKSDNWSLQPQSEFEEEIEEDTNWQYIIEGEQVPELDSSRRITNRPITIEELITAVEEVIEKEKQRAMRREERGIISPQLLNIAFEEREDFDLLLTETYDKIVENLDDTQITMFKDIVKDPSKQGVVEMLMPLLHLSNQGRIGLWQEKFFGELFITVRQDDRNQYTRPDKDESSGLGVEGPTDA